MVLTLFVFLHLVATCAAIGTILIADMRLVATMIGYRVVVVPPRRLEAVLIAVSLVLLYVTGAILIAIGLASNPLYLDNPKLQGKLIVVAVLTANAFVLHYLSFPLLGRERPVSNWSPGQWLTVCATVSLSNSMWIYSAFLGVARAWNYSVSVPFVLAVGYAVWLVFFVAVNVVLALASRDAPKAQRDWVDSTIATLSDFTRLAARSPTDRIARLGASANQNEFGRRVADRRVSGPPDRRGGGNWR